MTQNIDPSLSATCKKGSANDPITIETTIKGITDLRLQTHTNHTSRMATMLQSANTSLGETTEEFQTANDYLPPGNPCARCTRREDILTHGTSDESMKSTHGSSFADEWLLLTKRFLERVHIKSTEVDKAGTIIGHLEGEARNYVINKSEPERESFHPLSQ